MWTICKAMFEKSFSQRIKDARQAAGLSQATAARKWGFRKQTLSAWEKGIRNPAGLYKEKLERVLRRVLGD
jgi:DNA-binding XRE family transcriptional regulator